MSRAAWMQESRIKREMFEGPRKNVAVYDRSPYDNARRRGSTESPPRDDVRSISPNSQTGLTRRHVCYQRHFNQIIHRVGGGVKTSPWPRAAWRTVDRRVGEWLATDSGHKQRIGRRRQRRGDDDDSAGAHCLDEGGDRCLTCQATDGMTLLAVCMRIRGELGKRPGTSAPAVR